MCVYVVHAVSSQLLSALQLCRLPEGEPAARMRVTMLLRVCRSR